MENDTISRQDAIDALRNYLLGKNVPCDGTLTCRLIENEVISKLPSAQQKNENLKFLEFLWNTINPNEMEQYLEMYSSKEVKSNG